MSEIVESCTDTLNCVLTKQSSCNDWPKQGAKQMELHQQHGTTYADGCFALHEGKEAESLLLWQGSFISLK